MPATSPPHRRHIAATSPPGLLGLADLLGASAHIRRKAKHRKEKRHKQNQAAGSAQG